MNKIENQAAELGSCVVKILPIIDDKGEPQLLIPIDRIFLDSSKKFIYEKSGGDNILKKLREVTISNHKASQKELDDKLITVDWNSIGYAPRAFVRMPDITISKRYLVNILEEGKIKTVSIGSKTLMNLILENQTLLFSPNSDYHIDVVVDYPILYGTVQMAPCFDKSSVILKRDWVAPVSDVNSTEEWIEWIKANQDNNYLRHIESNSPLNHRELLDSLYDGNLSKIIANNRDKKISLVL